MAEIPDGLEQAISEADDSFGKLAKLLAQDTHKAKLTLGLMAMRWAELEIARVMGLTAATHFEGACPFITCLALYPHDHYICPRCGSLRFGNSSCGLCKAVAKKAIQKYPEGVRAVASYLEAHDRQREGVPDGRKSKRRK